MREILHAMFEDFDDHWLGHNHFRTDTIDKSTKRDFLFCSSSSYNQVIDQMDSLSHSDSSGSTNRNTPQTTLEILGEPTSKYEFAKNTPWDTVDSDSDYQYGPPTLVLDPPRRKSRPRRYIVAHEEQTPGWKAPPVMSNRNISEQTHSAIPLLPMPVITGVDRTNLVRSPQHHQVPVYASKNTYRMRSHTNEQHFTPVHTVSYPHQKMRPPTPAQVYSPRSSMVAPFTSPLISYVQRGPMSQQIQGVPGVPYYYHEGFRTMVPEPYNRRNIRNKQKPQGSSKKHFNQRRSQRLRKSMKKSQPKIRPQAPKAFSETSVRKKAEDMQEKKSNPPSFEPIDEDSIHAMAKNVQAIKLKIDERSITRHQALVTIYKKLEEEFQDILQDIQTLKQQDNFVFMLKVRSWEAIDKIQECMVDMKENATIQNLNITRYYKKGGDYKELFINLAVANESEVSKLMEIYGKYSKHIKRYAIRRNMYGRSSIHVIG